MPNSLKQGWLRVLRGASIILSWEGGLALYFTLRRIQIVSNSATKLV